LRAALFPAASHRATAVLMAGRSEFIEKYFEVVRDLNERGFSVATMYWRGQGLSERLLPEREKGHIRDFGVFSADLKRFVDEIVKKRFAGPYVLVTHSMGGVPALQMLADGDETFCAAVLTAPMTRLFDSLYQRLGVRVLARAATLIGLARLAIPNVREYSLDFEGNILTSDRARHKRFHDLQSAAPNATLREPTFGWLAAATEAMDNLHRKNRFRNLKTPVLIISADKDALVRSSDHQRLAEASPLIHHTLIKGALHEILMERDDIRADYWRAFDAFVEPRLEAAGAPSRDGANRQEFGRDDRRT